VLSLPNVLQDLIWSYRIEGYKERMNNEYLKLFPSYCTNCDYEIKYEYLFIGKSFFFGKKHGYLYIPSFFCQTAGCMTTSEMVSKLCMSRGIDIKSMDLYYPLRKEYMKNSRWDCCHWEDLLQMGYEDYWGEE